eukprot:scaffold10725_cov147-Cylindrotheca_fusiformis.AAC.1
MEEDEETPTSWHRENHEPYGPDIPPGTPDELAMTMMLQRPGLFAPATLRHVTRVSKRAALATKKQIWDSNDASIVAAQSAVDQWEQGYNALRGLLGMVGASASGLYGAAKAGATGLEHGFLLPVRDWVLLPAFGGVERIAGETVGFLQSEECRNLERTGLDIIRQVPFIGENILAPAVCGGAELMKRSWEIAQYPIPSPSQVRDSVDFVMTGTKWCIARGSEEILLYIKRADANITRTLSHTQWKVLGSGPYATLDKLNKAEVLDHLCERYFSLEDMVARYELAAHIRAHNRPLYHDLVLTGLLRERGGELTSDDEWLSTFPGYRESQSPFLLEDNDESNGDNPATPRVFPLWFRLPNHNGKRPSKEKPWERFKSSDRICIERFYQSKLREHKQRSVPPASTHGTETYPLQKKDDPFGENKKYSTNAKWYNPDLENDLLLNQKRHAVSLFTCCPKCRKRHETPLETPLVPKQFGELCHSCSEKELEAPWVDALLSKPPISAIIRPTMWRFYGPGDEVRRATWFLDTQRHGLQPYSEDAQAVLEDAYLFLKWVNRKGMRSGSTLLTVQVPSPDGSETHLVQFSSLMSATAIGKGLRGAISLFKQRVYRGAYLHSSDNKKTINDAEEENDTPASCNENSTTNGEQINQTALSTNEGSQGQSVAGRKSAREHIDEIETEVSEHGEGRPENDSDFELLSRKTALEQGVDESVSLAFGLEEKDNNSKEEKTKEADGETVDHLVLIVHGIGEMMLNFDLFGISSVPTIVDCCGFLRKNHEEFLNVRFSQMYQTLDGMQQPRRGRVEYLPIEWHESFTIHSRRRLLRPTTPESQQTNNYTINDISLRTIPQLRQFANDTLMDVLYFMSPEHHDIIVDIVVNEMNFVVDRFKKLTGFRGDVSVVGHSLGSIITWDILDNQGKDTTKGSSSIVPAKSSRENPENSETPSALLCDTNGSVGSLDDHPESISPLVENCVQPSSSRYPQLTFEVDNAFMLGSPIAVFLMIRNQRKPLATDFKLRGCERIFNIFHRTLRESRHGGFRFQYQTKRLWAKIVQHTLKTQETVIDGLESGFAALGLLDAASENDDEGDGEEEQFAHYRDHPNQAPRFEMGNLNRGEKEIENANEYVAALAAHSSYWLEKDLSLFIARQICLRALERQVGNDASFSKYNSF